MLTLTEWNEIHTRNLDWAMREMTEDSAHRRQHWVQALQDFWAMRQELFQQHLVLYTQVGRSQNQVEFLKFTPEELYILCHKYISAAQSYTAKFFLFTFWQDLRYYAEKDDSSYREPSLYSVSDFLQPATPEEIVEARKNFGRVKEIWGDQLIDYEHHFPDDAKVLAYRNQRFIIDEGWGDAWTLDINGKPHHFSLDWDWWYPIDEYLDLNNIAYNDKEEEIKTMAENIKLTTNHDDRQHLKVVCPNCGCQVTITYDKRDMDVKGKDLICPCCREKIELTKGE